MSCYSENEIVPIALEVISAYPGIRTSELIGKLREIMKPSGEDLEILDNRNDDKFSQKVRNIKSHDSIADQVYTVGEVNRRWYPVDYKGIVATAAHCVYDRTLGEFYDVSVEVYNQNAVVDDSNLLCSTDALYLHIPKLYIDSTGGAQDNYDYALIYVEADLSQYGIWPLGIVTTEFMDSSEEVVSSGFRYYNTIYARYYSRGAVIHFDEQEDAPNLIQYRLYSAGISYNGKSGGAAYYEDSFNNILYKSLIGVITGAGSPSNGSRTWSDRITPTLIRFYKQNDYLTN